MALAHPPAEDDAAGACFARAQFLLTKRFRLKQAAVAVNDGLALAPDAVIGHELLGLIALRRHRWNEAEAAYRRALAIDPERWTAMNDLGLALQGQRRKPEALEAFENAARLNPRSNIARGNLHWGTTRALGAGVPLLLFVAAEACLLALLPFNHSGWVSTLAIYWAVLTVPVAVLYLRSRRRLSPVARTFHAVESRRTRRIYVPFLTVMLAGAAVIVVMGGRAFLAHPTISGVIGVTAAVLTWLIGLPLLGAPVIRLYAAIVAHVRQLQ